MSERVALSFWRDAHFYWALLAAPVGWSLYAFFFNATVDVRWPDAVRAREIALVALLYPILEEIVFRAGLQQFLQTRLKNAPAYHGFTVANALTSLAFAAAHLWRHSAPVAGLVFFPSMILGYVYDRYGRVLPCIILHGFYNSGLLFLLHNGG